VKRDVCKMVKIKQDKIQLQTRLNNLLSRLCEVLRDLPGASGLYLFGSLAEEKSDVYSDIDLEVSTTDFPASLAARHSILERVGPIEIEWPITHSPDRYASTILFEKESYYHKVDIGLVAASQVGDVPERLRKKGACFKNMFTLFFLRILRHVLRFTFHV
jgi:predicted nucleotidyltransferase